LNIIKYVNKNLKNIIETTYNMDMNVPLLLEAKMGDNWLDVKDVD
jgi:DNA polymerase I-like protein with 3'-5' exonuclease and polymerase domains